MCFFLQYVCEYDVANIARAREIIVAATMYEIF